MGATLRATRTAGIAGAVLVASAMLVTGGMPSSPTVPSAAQGGDEDLLDRFFAVVEAVPTIDPADVLVSEFSTDVELLGDFISDHAQLEAVHDEAQQLFIDGDEARNAVGDLVAEGARAVMMIEDGYRRLADFELTVPFEAVDELEVATGTDEPRNLRAQGIDLVQQGQYRLEDVLVALRDVDKTDAQVLAYQDAVADAVLFAMSVDPALRDLSRDPVRSQIFTTNDQRYRIDIEGTAAARWVDYICVPRDAADALSTVAIAQAIAASISNGQTDDCPDLPSPEVLDPSQIVVDDFGTDGDS